MGDVLDRARVVAADVLLPAADEVDATATIPEGHFRALADAGLYGLAASPELGGPDVPFEDFLGIVETLAGACLTTTFTWMQHHGVVRGLAGDRERRAARTPPRRRRPGHDPLRRGLRRRDPAAAEALGDARSTAGGGSTASRRWSRAGASSTC